MLAYVMHWTTEGTGTLVGIHPVIGATPTLECQN